MTLKSMSVAQLQDLRGKVEAAISEKVTERRQELQAELTKLGHIDGRSARKARRGGPLGRVAPKYRDSKEPSHTWAGRGLQPLWLKEALKSGKKIESFLIK